MNKDEIIEILENNFKDDWLFDKANQIRLENVGNCVHIRGLIEFSNYCKCNCKYCGLQAKNKEIERYRLEPNEIINCAKEAIQAGYKTIVLQSGEDIFYDTDKMCEIIREIKKNDVALTLSIGEKTYEEYKAYKIAGADRYLLRIETTDEKLYENLHPNTNHKNRFQCLDNLKTLGYETGTGCMVGLPNQTTDSLADDILFFKELNADMIGIGPFISHPQTPLKSFKNSDLTLALKVMSLCRIVLPNINIPATTAMETLHPNGKIMALNSGANVIMTNITPYLQREKYQIYPNKNKNHIDILLGRSETEKLICKIGREVGQTFGNRINL